MRSLKVYLAGLATIALLGAAGWVYFFIGITTFDLNDRDMLGGSQGFCIEQSDHVQFTPGSQCRPENGLSIRLFGRHRFAFINSSEGDFTVTCVDHGALRSAQFGYYTEGLSGDGGPIPTCAVVRHPALASRSVLN